MRLLHKYQTGNSVPDYFEDLKIGISFVESSGGINMMNPTSSATGKYGQLYNEIKDRPEMKDVTREAFSKDTELQDKMFQLRFEEGFNAPPLRKNVEDLTREYKPQLGDKFTFRDDEVAALTNFLGRQGTRNYFASIRDGKSFKAPGVNKTPADYLKAYNEAIQKSKQVILNKNGGLIIKP